MSCVHDTSQRWCISCPLQGLILANPMIAHTLNDPFYHQISSYERLASLFDYYNQVERKNVERQKKLLQSPQFLNGSYLDRKINVMTPQSGKVKLERTWRQIRQAMLVKMITWIETVIDGNDHHHHQTREVHDGVTRSGVSARTSYKFCTMSMQTSSCVPNASSSLFIYTIQLLDRLLFAFITSFFPASNNDNHDVIDDNDDNYIHHGTLSLITTILLSLSIKSYQTGKSLPEAPNDDQSWDIEFQDDIDDLLDQFGVAMYHDFVRHHWLPTHCIDKLSPSASSSSILLSAPTSSPSSSPIPPTSSTCASIFSSFFMKFKPYAQQSNMHTIHPNNSKGCNNAIHSINPIHSANATHSINSTHSANASHCLSPIHQLKDDTRTEMTHTQQEEVLNDFFQLFNMELIMLKWMNFNTIESLVWNVNHFHALILTPYVKLCEHVFNNYDHSDQKYVKSQSNRWLLSNDEQSPITSFRPHDESTNMHHHRQKQILLSSNTIIQSKFSHNHDHDTPLPSRSSSLLSSSSSFSCSSSSSSSFSCSSSSSSSSSCSSSSCSTIQLNHSPNLSSTCTKKRSHNHLSHSMETFHISTPTLSRNQNTPDSSPTLISSPWLQKRVFTKHDESVSMDGNLLKFSKDTSPLTNHTQTGNVNDDHDDQLTSKKNHTSSCCVYLPSFSRQCRRLDELYDAMIVVVFKDTHYLNFPEFEFSVGLSIMNTLIHYIEQYISHDAHFNSKRDTNGHTHSTLHRSSSSSRDHQPNDQYYCSSQQNYFKTYIEYFNSIIATTHITLPSIQSILQFIYKSLTQDQVKTHQTPSTITMVLQQCFMSLDMDKIKSNASYPHCLFSHVLGLC